MKKLLNRCAASLQYEQGKVYARLGKHEKAIECFRKAAENGNANAQYEMGKWCESRQGVGENPYEAVAWYRKAAEQGNGWAQHDLANCYYHAKGVKQDYAEAFKWFQLAADNGIAWSQYEVGHWYEEGIFVEKDNRKAFEFYQRAAENGNDWAQYSLVRCYQEGIGTIISKELAMMWREKAAKQGNGWAQHELANCYYHGKGVKQDYAKAFKWFLRSADNGIAWSQYEVGHWYEEGIFVEKDNWKAFEFYKRAAENGNDWAQNSLARCYQEGVGVDKDEQEAVVWYKKAAEQGNAGAQDSLGWCYENGLGIDRNPREAVAWYHKAAAQGNAKAENSLGRCYFNGFGVDKDEQEAVVWYKKAAEQGNADAQDSLGWCYEDGLGVTRNYAKAFDLYRRSADQDNEKAKISVVRCRELLERCNELKECQHRESEKRFNAAVEAKENCINKGLVDYSVFGGSGRIFLENHHDKRKTVSDELMKNADQLISLTSDISWYDGVVYDTEEQTVRVGSAASTAKMLEEKIDQYINEARRLGKEKEEIDAALSEIYPSLEVLYKSIAAIERVKLNLLEIKRCCGWRNWEFSSKEKRRMQEDLMFLRECTFLNEQFKTALVQVSSDLKLDQYVRVNAAGVLHDLEGKLASLKKKKQKMDARISGIVIKACFKLNLIDSIVIDGSNLAYDENGERVGPSPIIAVANEVSGRYGFPITIVFDRDWERELPVLRKRLNNPDAVKMVCARNRADEEVLKEADSSKSAYIISNDRYDEFPDYSCVKENRIFKHHISNGFVRIDDLDIGLRYWK